MSPLFIIFLILTYFGILIGISLFTGKEDNANTFFVGNRDAKWYVIAFGMIGTSISGVTFISVPGAVSTAKFGYMQVVFGYLLGYLVVIHVLLPLYYKMNLTSIYQYLDTRFGEVAYKTGAFFFLISRLIGASLRLGVVAIVLQQLVFQPLGIPFWVAVAVSVLLIYVYTFQSGVKTVIWTDTVQTVGLLAGLIISIYIICTSLNWGLGDAISHVAKSEYSQIFFWDYLKPNFFFKNFIGGAAITIAMTGLDQDMMQKNLACKSLPEAQKNMYWFSFTLVFVNLLFLGLGALLYLYATEMGLLQMNMVENKLHILLKNTSGIFEEIRTDALFPKLANSYLGKAAAITFILGVIAAAYSSADSAMTALTSSVCIDMLGFQKKQIADDKRRRTRYLVHICIAFLTFLVILYFYWLNDAALIDKVLGIAGYTYGPLMGLFGFGIMTQYQLKNNYIPLICVTAAVISYFLQNPTSLEIFGSIGISLAGGIKSIIGNYKIGLEVLLINGILTFFGLWLIRKK